MSKRYVSLWFRHLVADWQLIRRPELAGVPYVFVVPDHGRKLITAISPMAEAAGIHAGMRAADAKAICHGLEIFDEKPGKAEKLLLGIGEWCIRFTPIVAVDPPDGLILEISGCTHLWGGERPYLKDILTKLKDKGYTVRGAMADTIGAAWGIARFGQITPIIPAGEHIRALLPLPPAALRLDELTQQKMRKLGFRTVNSFVKMKRSVLRRHINDHLLLRIDQATGQEKEFIIPLQVPPEYEERLPCLEPVITAEAIKIAIEKLLEALCKTLQKDGKGLRSATLKGYRIDGHIEEQKIGTNRPSHSVSHLFKLLEMKVPFITPALGIEVFTLAATSVEDIFTRQDVLWAAKPGLDDLEVAELLDRLAGKVGAHTIRRYLPDAHYWPERSLKPARSIQEKPAMDWNTDQPRPTRLLPEPEKIEVMAPVPDLPPKMFVYAGQRHEITKADGPERIEREWWMDEGEHRDYYCIEDKQGRRYWVFRSGHYDSESPLWYLHGFFA
ncbi:Y-family DNA polymerase [Mucilaginibacter terrae]|uniref:Protein ImuB n=1 Tax=Mucilaginibacter terrae TaxID=1955052 RepID=A0ABU3GNK1_9SPHI|nr:DNA polymerase Y family protein [Mucilaginibacter terrae]MDT3401349.1 protein ImuB [Mucilaginibacter terrae]